MAEERKKWRRRQNLGCGSAPSPSLSQVFLTSILSNAPVLPARARTGRRRPAVLPLVDASSCAAPPAPRPCALEADVRRCPISLLLPLRVNCRTVSARRLPPLHSLGHALCRGRVQLACSCCRCVMYVCASCWVHVCASSLSAPVQPYPASSPPRSGIVRLFHTSVQVAYKVLGQLTGPSQGTANVDKDVCFVQYATNRALAQHKG